MVIGGGLTGLWTALLARERDPQREVVLLEGERIAFGATGRNGGFMDASLTHGIENGVARWPDEMVELEKLGVENFEAIKEAMDRHGIDAGFEETGELAFATAPYQAEWIAEIVETAQRYGWRAEGWSAEQAREEVHSPTYHGAAYLPDGRAVVDPARLAWGLAAAAAAGGVCVYEGSPVTSLERDGDSGGRGHPGGPGPRPPRGARHQRLPAARARDPALRGAGLRLRARDRAARPRSGASRSAGRARQGLTDMANQFHYYRLTSDDRILWGGYDAVYNFRNGMGPHLDERPEPPSSCSPTHFFETFPQLEGVRFTHRWGGAIDTCSRFSVMFGKVLGGRGVFAVGYTGLGVAASRFGAQVALDLVDGHDTERTRLGMVRSKPVPFPPEPLRWAGITLTRRALAKADRNGGRRGPWLKTLDRLGMGFDS